MAIELPATIRLDGTDSFDPDGRVTEYEWELSDGRRFSQASPEVDFREGDAGSYTATLTVRDDDGASASDTVQFELTEPVNQPPTARFTMSQQSGVPPFTVTLDGSPSTDPDGRITEYLWTFTGKTAEKGQTVTKSFTKSDIGQVGVGLSIRDNEGELGYKQKSIAVKDPQNEPPNAVIQADAKRGREPLTVTFDASNSTPGNDPYDPSLSFEWFVNQNRVSNSGSTFTETFDAGTQSVKVKVTDSQGATDSAATTVDVKPPLSDSPTAVADATPKSGEVPVEVEFTGRNSSDPRNNIDTYEWEFSDGTTKPGTTVTRSFGKDAPQQVTGTLTVTDVRGDVDTDSVTVTLSQPGGIIGGIDNETVAQATIIGAGVASSLIFD